MTWAFIAFTVIGLSMAFLFIDLSKVEHLHNIDDSETFGFLNALAMNLLHLGQLSYPLSKKALATRILFLSSCWSSFVLFCFYTADLTSLMTSGVETSSIHSFENARSLGVKMAMIEGTALQTIIK